MSRHDLKLYQVKFDDQHFYVEAKTMTEAITKWQAEMLNDNSEDPDHGGWEGTEEPEGVTEIHNEGVIR